MTSERADNSKRQSYYGTGRQPWDDIVEAGWWIPFAAGNVLKYLRRSKDPERDDGKARWYLDRLREASGDADLIPAQRALATLQEMLTREEKQRVNRAQPWPR